MHAPTRNYPVALRALIAVTLTVGVVLRVIALAHGRSLWVDEAMLALNVATRSFWELTKPLDQLQLAPVLFLWTQRVAVLLGGVHDWVLRALPLICGALSLPLMFAVARRVAAPYTAWVALAALAISPMMIAYSAEAKPYAVDAFAVLLLLWIALRALERRSDDTAWRVLLVGGLVAPWFSFTSVCLLPFIGLACILPASGMNGAPAPLAESTGDGARVRRRGLIALGVWGVSAIASVTVASDASISEGMNEFWQGGFLALDGDGVRRTIQFARLMVRFAVLGAEQALPGPRTELLAIVAAVIAFIGVVWLILRSRTKALLIVGPLVAGYAASVAGKYPVASRLWLFAVPLILLAFVAGLESLSRLPPATLGRWMAVAVGVTFLLPGLWLTARFARKPPMYQHSRPVINALLREHRADEPVYVFARATPAWLFYTTDWRGDVGAVRSAMRAQSPPDGPAFINSGVMGRLTSEYEPILTRRVADRLELLGVASGYRIGYFGNPAARVAPEWAAAEVARIRRAGASCVMLFLVHVMPAEESALFSALAGTGGAPRWRFDAPGSKAVRVCFNA